MSRTVLVILALMGIALTIFYVKEHSKPLDKKNSIIFFGHIYHDDYSVDRRLEYFKSEYYDYIWLGGDICARTDDSSSTLDYLDSLFDLKAPGHSFAIGNHDVPNNNIALIEKYTGRNEFYTEYVNGMTLMTLNTNLYAPECDRMQEQFDMFKAVCDTIQASSHLVVLSHHIIWDRTDSMPSMAGKANANKGYWEVRCQPNSMFQEVWYDMLVAVQQRGVQVLFIAGDYGQRDKAFQHQCPNGIWFLASGIDRFNKSLPQATQATAKDSILYLEHNPVLRTLEWEFLDLDSMSKVWEEMN